MFNTSNWIYFGLRFSAKEIKKRYGNDPSYSILINNIEDNDYVCYTQAGSFLKMNDGDNTFEEYAREIIKELKL